MDYDFDYYSGADLIHPKRPVRPSVPDKNSSQKPELFREYADDLEIYNQQKEYYDQQVKLYTEKLLNRKEQLKSQLMIDYNLSPDQFKILWSKAWEDGHSSGLREVVLNFDELYDLVVDFNRH